MTSPQSPLDYASSDAGLREIAGRQRAIILCILGQIFLYVILVSMQNRAPLMLALAVLLLFLAVTLTGTVFTCLLSIKLYGTAVGVVLGILTLVPCVGLIVLLIVNGKATAILKKNGIAVGLLGAKM